MRTVVLFGVAGGVGFLIDLTVMLILRGLGADYLLCRGLSVFLAIGATWFLNRSLAFKGSRRSNIWDEMRSYYLGNLLGAGSNYILFQLLVHRYWYLAEKPWIALAIGAVLGLLINFAWARAVTFRSTLATTDTHPHRNAAAFTALISVPIAIAIWGFQSTWHLGLVATTTNFAATINDGVAHLTHYPWTDMAENAIIGFNLANGQVFERETVVTHMPLIYQYLQLWFELFGVNKGTPSPQLAAVAYSVSAYATALAQVLFISMGAWAIGFRWGAALIAFVYVGFCASAYALSFPLSENIIPFIVFTQFAFLHAILFRTASRRTLVTYGALLLTALPLINLLTGLSIFPSVVFLWVASAAACTYQVRIGERSINNLPLQRIILPILVCAILVVFEIVTVDHEGMWFWNFEINRNQLNGISPIDTIRDALFVHWHYLNQPHVLGSNLYELMAVIVVFIAASLAFSKSRTRSIYIISVGFIFAILCQWRENTGFKSELFHGFTWLLASVVVLWTTQVLMTRFRQFNPLSAVAALAVFSVAVSIFYVPSIVGILNLEIFINKTAPRPSPFDQAQVCRLRQETPCRCLQVTSFGPQFFLENDIRQCSNRFSTFAKVLFKNDQVRQNLASDLQNPSVAFLRFPREILEIAPENQDADIIDRLYGAGSNCIPYAGDASLCFSK